MPASAMTFRRALISAVSLLWLVTSGCFLCGNGEPICGAKQQPPSSGSSGGVAGSSTPAGPDGIYYRLVPGYRCTPSGGGASLPSYVSSIQIVAGAVSAVLTGDRCQATQTTISVASLTVSGDLNLIGYHDGIYEKSISVPDGTGSVVEAWCRSSDSASSPALEIVVHGSGGSSGTATLFASWASPNSLTVNRQTNGTTRQYSATSLDLEIDLSEAGGSSLPDTYPADIPSSPSGYYYGQASCRVLLP